jgi:hypothetical protein
MSHIHVHIEHLIVERPWGASLSASALQEAFEAGLARMLGTPGAVSVLSRIPSNGRASALMVPSAGESGRFGTQLAEAVYQTLIQPDPTGPGPNTAKGAPWATSPR